MPRISAGAIACTVVTLLIFMFVVSAAIGQTDKGGSVMKGEEGDLTVWSVDPLVKVFRDAQPASDTEATADVARGEVACLQIVVRCDKAIKGLRAEVAGLDASIGGREFRLRDARVRYVGYVPVTIALPDPPADRLRMPPADYPDPLLEDPSIDVEAGQAQPVWIIVPISQDAKAGVYKGEVHISGEADGRRVSADFPITVHVYDVKIGKSRLWVTNWFNMRPEYAAAKPAPYSPEYWTLVHRYAKTMADHRQNVVLTQTLDLVGFTPTADGSFTYEFSIFDKWVNAFIEEGAIGRIEGGHFGGRTAGWNDPMSMRVVVTENGKAVPKWLPVTDPEIDRFYSKFLPALVEHLKAKGWFDRYMQHLGDEPNAANAESYRVMAAIVHKYAPGMKTVEACHTKDLAGAIDIWVPQMNYLDNDYANYKDRQSKGEELWFYTCVYPQGEYANRFLELPLIKTRLLHWVNYRYGVTGYLHWGLNQWRSDISPYKTTEWTDNYLPAGDMWIVYPGKDGLVSSIRYETMRDGIADYELLCMLEEKQGGNALRLAANLVLGFAKYDTDVAAFRETRRKLLDELSKKD